MTINTDISLVSFNRNWNILLNILHNLCIPIFVSKEKENEVIDISLLPIILLIIFIF